MVMLLVPYLINGRFLQYPGEAIFMRNVLGWDRYQPSGRDIENLQTFLSLLNDSQATYPLLTFIEPSTPNKPNIILYVIESLRGSDIKIFNSKGSIEMTSFDRFAKSGISFPHFISNGYPSTEGFMSLSMGIWPHARERLVISHHGASMPSLASQLSQKGYSTYRIEDRDDPEEEGYWIKPTFDHHITFTEDKEATEKNMVDTLISVLENNGDPVYIHLKTRNPHYPYQISNDSTNSFYQIGKPSENYPFSMEMIDKHLNRLYDYLERTQKFENTIIIITGDHSNLLDKTHQSPLPYNETVWTGAIIAGDSSLIGNPRIDQRNCSQVDISTTLLNLTGGNCNWVGFGQNLLKSPDNNYAIAIRPAGVRLDCDGYSYLLSRSEPTKYQIKQAFPDLEPAIEPMPPLTPEELFNLVDTWAYLIDNNRAFDDTKQSNQ